MKFFEFLAWHYYGEGLMIFTSLIAFIFSLRHYGRCRALRIIPYYLGFFLLAEAVEFNWFASPAGDRFPAFLERTTTGVLTIFEFCVFSLLILSYITGPGRRLAIRLNALIFLMAEAFFIIRAFPEIPIYLMCLLEPIALMPLCAIYFYELFTIMDTKSLKDRPSFLIVAAIINLGICSLTVMLSFAYVGRFGIGVYAMGNVIYSILFVLFMRAYKCDPEENASVSR